MQTGHGIVAIATRRKRRSEARSGMRHAAHHFLAFLAHETVLSKSTINGWENQGKRRACGAQKLVAVELLWALIGKNQLQ